jgi:hypothetical protein
VTPPEAKKPVGDKARDTQLVIPIDAARKRSRRLQALSWVAAAAGIMLAIGAWLWASQREARVEYVKVEKTGPKVEPIVESIADQRARLLATAKDATTLTWTATTDPFAAKVAGDVVWSNALQQGYMRFTNLAVNDRSSLQYQLWIFDEERNQDFPVDGGVFDATTGEVIVPISAKLRVGKPVLFAVTVEKAGGVVVSKRERIVVTAKPA